MFCQAKNNLTFIFFSDSLLSMKPETVIYRLKLKQQSPKSVADEMGVSRQLVWYAIQTLNDDKPTKLQKIRHRIKEIINGQ